MKLVKWVITFILTIFICTGLLGVYNYVVDPFGVFGDKLLKWHSYNMVNNPRVAKIGYLDQYYEEYDSYIIGGSKSSSLAPELLNEYYGDANFYSMMMYGGDFYDYEKTLYYLVENYNVENIIIHHSMFEVSEYNKSNPNDVKETLHAKVSDQSELMFYLRYLFLNPMYGIEKLEGYAKRAIDPFEYSQIKPEDGVYNRVRRDAEPLDDLEMYVESNPEFLQPLYNKSTAATDDNIAVLKRMKEYCEEQGISFTFVTGATFHSELERYNIDELKSYWIKLAEVTDFWDFSGYTSVSFEPRYFYDRTHYRNLLGEKMLAFIFDDDRIYVPEGFGHYTTRENVEEHISRIFNVPEEIPSDVFLY